MPIRVCVAGATGWTGSLITAAIMDSADLQLVGAIARQKSGQDIGEVLGKSAAGVKIVQTLTEALSGEPEVLIDYTKPDSVKGRILDALGHGVRVVVGTSGLTSEDYLDVDRVAREQRLGVIAAGNFSMTAALMKHFAETAARYLPSWEVIDYAHADKVDAPSGTARELAEELAKIAENQVAIPIDETHGPRESRGASIGGAQVHSIRLPGYVIGVEVVFGRPHERLTIRHDAGSGADPYVAGTLLAAQKVMDVTGLVRGLDRLLFES
jgi:4-hydroxy-tetrahydrodipicolinate reductase